MTEDGLRRDGFFFDFPAIVIGDHGHCRECDLRFARQFCFWKIRHRDHVEAVSTVKFRFRARGKRRAVHVHVNATIVNRNSEKSG